MAKIGEKEAARRALREGRTARPSDKPKAADDGEHVAVASPAGKITAVSLASAGMLVGGAGSSYAPGDTISIVCPACNLPIQEAERALAFYRKHRERSKKSAKGYRGRMRAKRKAEKAQ